MVNNNSMTGYTYLRVFLPGHNSSFNYIASCSQNTVLMESWANLNMPWPVCIEILILTDTSMYVAIVNKATLSLLRFNYVST